jgi:hypothetical protein
MAKRDAFVAKGLRIETWRSFDGRVYTCWKPDVSLYCTTRKEVLKFAAWPAKTPTGDALRAQLNSWEQQDLERAGKVAEPVGDANVEGSFDPLAHDVDNDNTRMIT